MIRYPGFNLVTVGAALIGFLFVVPSVSSGQASVYAIQRIYVPLDPSALHGSTITLRKNRITVTEVIPVSKERMHVVFVIDRAKHQASMLSMTEDYVKTITRSLADGGVRFRIDSSDSSPENQELDADRFTAALPEMFFKMTERNVLPPQSLAADVRRAVDSIPHSGGGVVVVISDGDDDINSKAKRDLALTLARTHVRLFSLLLAFHYFYGTKEHSEWGLHLGDLSVKSGGGQYETDFQGRRKDESTLAALARWVQFGSLVSISAVGDRPVSVPVCLDVRAAGGRKTRSAYFIAGPQQEPLVH